MRLLGSKRELAKRAEDLLSIFRDEVAEELQRTLIRTLRIDHELDPQRA